MNLDTALLFSGGKDSLACLYLLEPRWPEIYVCWLNTGAAFPETIELMERTRRLVPHFIEVRMDVQADIDRAGWPVDVLPVQATPMGRALSHTRGPLMRTWIECCFANYWWPLQQKILELGVRHVIRGERLSEQWRSPVRDGMAVNGITYHLPLEEWSAQQVEDFLRERSIEIPAYYTYTGKSLDCWCCTALLDKGDGHLKYLRERHPQKYALVRSRLEEIHGAQRSAFEPIEAAVTVQTRRE